MSLIIGLVGLPNAGKSTLFNAITGLSVPAENYPFTTIDPNIGIVSVLDDRVITLTNIVKPDKTTYAQIEVRDIAGLVKGAAEGEGLGNKFLANIREVDGILMVIRGFKSSNVLHVLGSVDPARDREVLETELILKDLDTVNKRLEVIKGFEKSIRPQDKIVFQTIKNLSEYLNSGKMAVHYQFPDSEDLDLEIKSMQLLTAKPFVYLLNTDENLSSEEVAKILSLDNNSSCISMDVSIEQEIMKDAKEQNEEVLNLMLTDLGIEKLKLPQLIQLCFSGLGYQVFLTAGEQEVRSWPMKIGLNARQAAKVIHNDFEKKFIAVEVANYPDFVSAGSWEKLKEQGKVRLEGKEYVIKDGEVVFFKIGA